MKVKKYVVSTMAEALTQIKAELGSNAVILSTRQLKPSGLLSKLGRHASLEVTAAVDASGGYKERGNDSTNSMPPASKILERIAGEHLSPMREGIEKIQEQIGAIAENVEGTTAVYDLLKQVKQMMEGVTVKSEQNKAAASNVVEEMAERLLWHRVDHKLVVTLVDELLLKKVEMDDFYAVRDIMAQLLMAKLPDTAPVKIGSSEALITAIIGPTGAGKTTTLVKLASELALNKKLSIAFINLDQFRVGAKEQLSRYAQILGCPSVSVTSRDELEAAIKSFADKRAILIDTTGRSFNDRKHLSELAALLDTKYPIVKQLVMPAQVQDPEADEILRRYSTVGFDKIIISKLDEAVSFGTLINATYRTKKPLSYFTIGQQVPDDIELATKERVVDCVFNYSGDYSHSDELKKRYVSTLESTLNSREMPI